MNEIQMLLQQTLRKLEQDISSRVNLLAQEQDKQQRQLAVQEDLLKRVQTQIKILQDEREQSARHLQGLSAVYSSLELLLAKLNSLLSGG